MSSGLKKTEEFVDMFVQDPRYRDDLVYVESVDSFYLFDASYNYYRMLQPREFERIVYSYFKHQLPRSISRNLTGDFIYQIKMSCYRQLENTRSHYTALKDCFLNMSTFALEPFDRGRMAFHYLPVASHELSQPIPKFRKFLDYVLVDKKMNPDKELQAVYQEMLGFYLLNDLKAHAVFFLLGNGANGKSRLVDIITAMTGEHFISAQNIQTLTTNSFALPSLIGKKINICSEEESKYLRSDRFKALVSGDPIQAEWKYGATFMMRPETKYLFLTNKMLSFDSINYGLKRRIKIIPFYRKISDAERDPDISDKLLTELPGIIGWAIEGAKRLVANRYNFSDSEAMKETIEEFENVTSGALMFFREMYVEDPKGFIPNTELYEQYKQWCAVNGRKPMNSNNFGKDLSDMLGLETEMRWDAATKKSVRGRHIILKSQYEQNNPGNR